MLREEDKGPEKRRELPNEAGIIREPLDVAFVPAVHEDGTHHGGSGPVVGVEEVPLRESGEIGEAEVVQRLIKVPGLVPVLVLVLVAECLGMGFGEERETAGETWGLELE